MLLSKLSTILPRRERTSASFRPAIRQTTRFTRLFFHLRWAHRSYGYLFPLILLLAGAVFFFVRRSARTGKATHEQGAGAVSRRWLFICSPVDSVAVLSASVVSDAAAVETDRVVRRSRVSWPTAFGTSAGQRAGGVLPAGPGGLAGSPVNRGSRHHRIRALCCLTIPTPSRPSFAAATM